MSIPKVKRLAIGVPYLKCDSGNKKYLMGDSLVTHACDMLGFLIFIDSNVMCVTEESPLYIEPWFKVLPNSTTFSQSNYTVVNWMTG